MAQKPRERELDDADQHLVNDSDLHVSYTHTTNGTKFEDHDAPDSAGGKKKNKKKKPKGKKQSDLASASSVQVTGAQLEDPGQDYPESRVLTQDHNGDVLVSSLDATTPPSSKKSIKKSLGKTLPPGSFPSNRDEAFEMDEELKNYWQQMSFEEKKSLLNLERDSVFKVMKDQQKITCNCSVCGRKRKIIEDELTKLYESYYERLKEENFTKDLFGSFTADDKTTNSTPPITAQESASEHSHASGQKRQERRKKNAVPSQNTSAATSANTTRDIQQQQEQSQQQQLQQQQQPQASADLQGSTESARRNGIMSVAEDLLQNDGKRFLEMMEKLAESRIKRQSELLKRPDLLMRNADQLEEEEDYNYNHDFEDDIDDDHVCGHDHNHDGHSHFYGGLNYGSNADDYNDTYKVLPLPDIELPEDPVSFYYNDAEYVEEEDEDYTDSDDEEDSYGEYSDDEEENDWTLESQTDLHEELVEILRDQSDHFARETAALRASNNDQDRQLLQKHLERQQQLQNQLQRERNELRQLQDDYLGEGAHANGDLIDDEEEDLEEDIEDYDDDEDDHDHDLDEEEEEEDEGLDDEDEDGIDEDDDEEVFSDDAIDEEAQLAEGRNMLQLCTTKMLRQSLYKSYRDKKIQEQAQALLREEMEAAEREKRKEEKKLREKEKKKEKKKALQQQKEEERLKKLADQERLEREKREEMIRKTEEGRKRKEEAERKKKEEKRRKEEEEEQRRKAKEEKRRLKEEQKRQEEEEQRLKEEAERLKKEEELRIKREKEAAVARKKREEAEALARKKRELEEAKLLQQKLKREEVEQQLQLQYAQQLEAQLEEKKRWEQEQEQLLQIQKQQHEIQQRSNSNISMSSDIPPRMGNGLLDGFYNQPGSFNTVPVAQNQMSSVSGSNPSGYPTPQQSRPPINTSDLPNWGPAVLDPSLLPTSAPQSNDHYGTNLFNQAPAPSLNQNGSVDQLISSLSSTNLDSYNSTTGGLFVPDNNLWSNGSSGGGWGNAQGSTASTAAHNTNASAARTSPFGAFGVPTEQPSAPSIGLGGLWGSAGTAVASTPAPTPLSSIAPPPGLTSTPAVPPTPASTSTGIPPYFNDNAAFAEDLVRQQQTKIYKAYQILQIPDRPYIRIDSLYRAFSGLFDDGEHPTMDMFVQILKSPSEEYDFDLAYDELMNVSLVKCSQLSRPPLGIFGSRSGSTAGFGALGSHGNAGGSGSNLAGGLFGMGNGLTSSPWGLGGAF